VRFFLLTVAFCSVLPIFTSCTTLSTSSSENPSHTNPYPAGSIEHFQASREYLHTYNSWVNQKAYEALKPSETSITISVSAQRGFLKKGDQTIIDYPISSGKTHYETPLGSYKILEKKADKKSNVYGKIYNENGEVVNEDADIREVKLQQKERFEGAKMAYWMRMTWDGVGHHVGLTPRHPASHSCVRGHHKIMPLVFEKVQLGTIINIIE